MKILDYSGGTITACKQNRILTQNVEFCIDKGEFFALVGETGSGKSLTALSVAGLLPKGVKQVGARILFCGTDIFDKQTSRRLSGDQIVYIPQSGGDCLNPKLKVKAQIFDGLKKQGISKPLLRTKMLESLCAVGFEHPEDVAEKYSFQLSGGMAQKVTLALALSPNAKLVICDEATNGLDAKDTALFTNLVSKLFPDAAVMVITHDISVAERCDKIGVLCGGVLVESGKAKDVLNSSLHPYTKALKSAVAQNGMSPSPKLREPKGECPFFARCPLACEKCLGKIPTIADKYGKRRCAL